jgi:glutamate-5-semialdehyde dehydrogenase
MDDGLLKLTAAAAEGAEKLASFDGKTKNNLLLSMADHLLLHRDEILKANETDLKAGREKGLSAAMLDRLMLNLGRLEGMADAIREIVELPDPVGKISDMRIRPNGLEVEMMSIPLGVIAIIYEARPNVTSDAAALCIKSGNAVILRGGSEAFNSNLAIIDALHKGLEFRRADPALITFVPTTDRATMLELLKMDKYIDLVIPRGGEGLIRFVAENSRIPVIKHYKGICHLYVDKDADIDIALRLLIDGKTSRPGVCNALETMLVHKEIASRFLPAAGEVLRKKNVEIRGCPETCAILPEALSASPEDYDTEYLALIISSRVVSGYDEAVEHIRKHGSDHTEVIVTNNLNTSRHFVRDVNSSSVMVNASSRFSDGGELGLGAEIGISTSKLHAFGPMGLESLTTRKFVVIGTGQTRNPVE